MLAALSAGQRKVSIRIAQNTAEEYRAAVGLAKPRYGVKLAAITSTALASLMLLGLAYPNAWSAWILNRAVSAGEVISHETQLAARRSRRQQDVRIAGEAKIAALTPRPSQLSGVAVGPGTAAPARSGAAVPATKIPATPERRSQIIVREGDTLENIAVRYLGSNSGINQLIEANPHLTDINQLNVGQVIYLPPGISAKVAHDQAAVAASGSNAQDSPGAN